MCMGCVSISFWAVILFLIISLKKEREFCMLEKQKVLGGHFVKGNKLRYIQYDSGVSLLNIVSNIGNEVCLVAAVFENGRFAGELNQQEIFCYINRYGIMHTAGECLHYKMNMKCPCREQNNIKRTNP